MQHMLHLSGMAENAPARKSVTQRTKLQPKELPKKNVTKHIPQELKLMSKKRAASENTVERGTIKKLRKADIISRPSQILDIFVCGEGELGELGLGAHRRNGRKPVGIKSPRLNDLLSAHNVVQASAGGLHCAALTYDSKVLTWGVNDTGALGRDTDWQPTPESNVTDGDNDTSDDDDGDDDLGINPLESTPTPIPMEHFGEDATSIVQVAATDCATFALTAHGSVYGWGTFNDDNGTLGFSTDDALQKIRVQKTPKLIPHLKNITALATGGHHVLALAKNGTVFAWGNGQQNQLGVRNYAQRSKDPVRGKYTSLTPSPVFLPGKKITSISCGSYHSFAVDNGGHVYAWGLNNFGQTGISRNAGDDVATIELPTLVQSLISYEIRDIRGGNHHSIACCTDGAILVWGRCDDAQMGISLETIPSKSLLRDDRGRPRILLTPTKVPSITGVSVAAGIDNSLSITKDGKAYSWGFSANYRTGLRTEESVQSPTLVENSAVSQRKLTIGACGGQFLLLAGPRLLSNGV